MKCGGGLIVPRELIHVYDVFKYRTKGIKGMEEENVEHALRVTIQLKRKRYFARVVIFSEPMNVHCMYHAG